MAPSRITRLEIQAWEDDEGIQLERWERRALLMVDAAWLQNVSKTTPDLPPEEEESD
jgi:hypothetical protein